MLLDEYLDYLQESSVIKKILRKLKRKKLPKIKEPTRAERRAETLEKLRKRREADYRRRKLKRKGII